MRASLALLRSSTPDWWPGRACAGVDSEIFYPDEDDLEQVAAAKAICAGCPVALECLEHAIASREPFGVWGGRTERERRNVHRRRVRDRRGGQLVLEVSGTA